MSSNNHQSIEMTLRPNGRRSMVTLWESTSGFLLRYGAFIALLAVTAYFSIGSPVFLTSDNILNVLRQVSSLAIVSFGMAAVVMGGGTDVLAGGIDLSIGAIVALVIAVCTLMIASGQPVWLALLAGLGTALLIEAINAVMVVYVGLVPLLATLAMMFTINGVELVFTNNKFISLESPFIDYVAEGSIGGLPVMVVIMIVTFLFYYLLLHWTPAGIHIQAVGGSHEAAQTSAISINFYTVLTYLLAGVAATISAILAMARLSGSAPGVASVLLLDIVLATYVSAAFSPRWTVNIPGTLLGALFVWILTNGFTLLNVPTYWVHGVKGIIVLIVVSSASLQQKGASR